MRALIKKPLSKLNRLCAVLVLGMVLLGAQHASAFDNERVALVIGNDMYPNEPLKNAVNDARAMQKSLQELGFKVVFKPNADINTMRAAAVEFAKMMDGATAAVFFYAGHGIQYSNKNYLIPVDAKLMSEPEIVYYAMEVGQILDSMEEAKVRHKFIILDACRNNPFRNLFTSSTGLAKSTRVPPGTFISYAAAAGAVALDGEGENGLYTKHLLKEIRTPGYTASAMFERVGSQVAQESNGRQYPENTSTPSPRGAFFFSERNAALANANPAAAGVSGDTAVAADREFWASVKDSRKIEEYQAYLAQFPSGIFATLARSRIDAVRQERAQQQVAATPLSTAPANTAPVLIAERTGEPAARPAASAALPAVAPVTQPAATQAPVTAASVPVAAPQTKPAAEPAVPIRIAAAPAGPSATSEVRGLEPRGTAAAPAPSATAPGANQVAALSPEQKTSLPLLPVWPKFVTGPIDYPNGDRYVGEYKVESDKKEILHGKGEYVSKGFRYNGEFKDNKKQGKGVYVWSDGAKYTGDFADDQASGKGIWEFASGDKYEGDVLNAVMVGKGVLTSKDGSKFEGTFADGKPHGRGTYIFANGDKYEGGIAAGKKSGKGIYVSKNGDRLDVSFVDDVAQGNGSYDFANGDRYEGEIKNGALSGKGKYFHSGGERSEGSYVNGLLSGQGTFYFKDGSWFEGTFEDGLKRAKGIIIYKDGTKRAAEIVNGNMTVAGG
jgi:uncharacterized caspase-like protein